MVNHGHGLGSQKNIGENDSVREIRRILFIRTDRMGDLLMNLPALRVLRQAHPKAWIALLADCPVSDFFKNHPDLDEVIAIEAAGVLQNRRKRWELVRKIRAIHFDLAVASNSSKFFHGLLFLSGIPIRVGWRRKWSFLLNRSLPDTKDKAIRHEIDSNLDLIGLISDKKWDGGFTLPEDEKSTEKICALLAGCDATLPVVVVHPGTSNPKKRWPAEHFIELCERLLSTDQCRVVLIGGEEEADLSQKIVKQLSKPALDLTGRLTLKELAAFFKQPQVKTLVSSDSGPVHVAWMSGKPVVVFYAMNVDGCHPARWGPRDGKSEVIFKPMNEINVDEVWERVQSFL